MVRVNSSSNTRNRHRKVIDAAKGYRGKRKSTFRLAKQAVMKAGMHAYVGRKQKKRDFRRLWITRISIALRDMGLRYSEVKNNWLHARMNIDRRSLANLAVNYPKIFSKIANIKTDKK